MSDPKFDSEALEIIAKGIRRIFDSDYEPDTIKVDPGPGITMTEFLREIREYKALLDEWKAWKDAQP